MAGFILGTGSGVLAAAAVYYTISTSISASTSSLRSEYVSPSLPNPNPSSSHFPNEASGLSLPLLTAHSRLSLPHASLFPHHHARD
jgi:hypothetical protein